MSDIETLQKSFMDSMDSMQKQFQQEKEIFEKKIIELKEKNIKLKKEKDTNNELFKQSLKSNSEEISRLQNKNRELEKKLESYKSFNQKVKQYQDELSTMKEVISQIDQLNVRIQELEMQIKSEKEQKKTIFEQLDSKNKEIIELNEQIKKCEQKNKELLQKIKKGKEQEEKWKIEKDMMAKFQREKENKLKEEENKLKEENNKLKEEENKLKEEENKLKEEENKLKEEENKIKEEENKIKEKIKEMEKNAELNIEKKNKFLSDVLCEFLIKLNNSPHTITVFDLLNKSLKNFEDLNYFAKMSLKYNLHINDISYYFFSNLRSYILLRKENCSLKNFLSQKSFKYSEIDKEDIETIKMIRTIKLSEENNLLDLYKKKKDLFNQKVELTFDLLKNKILSSDEEEKKENNNKNISDIPDILNIVEPPINLEIDFDKINLNKLSSFISFQINNIFTKLEKLEIEVSKINLDIFYSIVFNCQNLKSISIKLNNQNLESNIVILNNIIPILLNNNKSLKELCYYNIPLMNKYLSNIVTSLKNSKLEQLTLSGCFTSKADLAIFNSYFSSNNDLSQINFSFNHFNIPSLLSESLLNYNINKKLTSINFSHCELSDDDINIIAKYCEENALIKTCDISYNNISQKSCFKLGTMIEKNSGMEKINLMSCNLSGEFLLCIFSYKGSKGLKHIILNNNNIGDMGLIGISGFIKNSPKLETLELIDVGGNDMGFTTLLNCVKICGNIKNVHFEKNKISKGSIDMIKILDEEFKTKGIKFFLDKIEGEKNIENFGSVEFI